MVKCSDCGYLGVWAIVGRQWLHADEEYRTTGRVGVPDIEEHYHRPRCFAVAFDLSSEVKQSRDEPTAGRRPHWDAIVAVVSQDRECSRHIKWNPGFTPKEHREMIDAERLRDWQAKREDDDKKWRAEQAREDMEWREEQRREERESRAEQENRADRRNKAQIRAVAFWATLALVLAQLAAAFIQVVLPWLLSRAADFTH